MLYIQTLQQGSASSGRSPLTSSPLFSGNPATRLSLPISTFRSLTRQKDVLEPISGTLSDISRDAPVILCSLVPDRTFFVISGEAGNYVDCAGFRYCTYEGLLCLTDPGAAYVIPRSYDRRRIYDKEDTF